MKSCLRVVIPREERRIKEFHDEEFFVRKSSIKIQHKLFRRSKICTKYVVLFWGKFLHFFCTVNGCYFRVKKIIEFSSIPHEEFHFFPRSSQAIENRGKYDMYSLIFTHLKKPSNIHLIFLNFTFYNILAHYTVEIDIDYIKKHEIFKHIFLSANCWTFI